MSWQRLEPYLFVLAVGCCLIPLWVSGDFITQDGPRHLHLVALASALSGTPSTLVDSTYTLHLEPLPGILGHGLLAILTQVCSQAVANQLAFSLACIGIPISTRFTLRMLDAKHPELAWLSLPLVHSLLLALGLLSFCLSLGLFILGLGICIRSFSMSPGRSVPLLMGFGILLYFAHPMTYLLLGLCIAVIHLSRWGFSSPNESSPALVKRSQDLGWHALAFLPSLMLMGWFMLRPGDGGAVDYFYGIGERLVWLFQMNLLLTTSVFDLFPALGLLTTLLILATLTVRRSIPQSMYGVPRYALLLAAAACTLFTLCVPDRIGSGSLAALRGQVFIWLSLILWLGVQPWTSRWSRAVAAVCACITGIQIAIAVPHQIALNRDAREIRSLIPSIQAQRTLLPIVYSSTGLTAEGLPRTGRTRPLSHITASLATATSGVELGNYQSHTSAFSVRYRPNRDPFHHLAADATALEREPPEIDVKGYEDATGGTIDYAVVIAEAPDAAQTPAGKAIQQQLDRFFRPVLTTQPNGLATLYERIPLADR